MFPNVIRMILLKSKSIPENYAINVNSIISIDLKRDYKIGQIKICTADKSIFKIFRKSDGIYDFYMKIISFCTNSNSDVIPDNNILEIESDFNKE